MKIDVVIGAQLGDESKGKIVKHLLDNGNYNIVAKASGGGNAGHTFYHNDKKFVTHHIPAGVFRNLISIIGTGCVVHPRTFLKEIEDLEANGINASRFVKISENAQIVSDAHIEEDTRTDKIGSTKRGIAQAYRDKYARIGIQAKDCSELKDFVCDQYEFLMREGNNILIEGSQGIWLCVDHSPNYPFVTSSSPSVAFAFHSLGLPIQKVNRVFAAAKCYETYVGAMKFQPDDEIFKQIAQLGREFGATTGRLRQVNWLNLDLLDRAITMNGVTDLVVSKMDILQQINFWTVRYNNGDIRNFPNEESFKNALIKRYPNVNILFSYSPKDI